MAVDANAVAGCVLAAFDQLEDKRKPRPRSDGTREWVPLAGIVLSKGSSEDGKLSCVSLGTGMKCLPHNKLAAAHGNILHDWHAEVLTIRAFNRFLLDQCLLVSTPPYPTSDWIRQRPTSEHSEHQHQPFAIRSDVQIHMYCSEAPCGDASMELVMDAQEDATPWTSPPPTISAIPSDTNITEATVSALRGRSNFSALGLVRLKPSRPDAPPTLSKSCTDKLALCQGTSLLSSVSSLLIHPSNAYITTLILPSSQYVPKSIERAFSNSGRLAGMSEKARQWKGGYVWKGFEVKTTDREFTWSRRMVLPGTKSVASNLSAVYTPGWTETLIGGVLQGRKQLDPRGASRVCRRRIWDTAVKIAAVVCAEMVVRVLGQKKYADIKTDEALIQRNKVKQAIKTGGLNGWIPNTGDSTFALDESSSS